MNISLKHIVICADDFSLNPAINAGILDLLTHQRLSAVSCMTQSPTWREDAHSLLPFRGLADIGLHFNLTHPFETSLHFPLPALILRASFRVLAGHKVRDCLRYQLDAFETAMGTTPDFIDGHQHVHQFPVIRDILVDECVRRYSGQLPYIRSLGQMPGTSGFKAQVLQLTGAAALERELKEHCIPHNSAFAGLYSLEPDPDWAERMRNWLVSLPTGGLVMCHPAQSLDAFDSIAAARVAEYDFLSSADWPNLLGQCGVQAGRLFQ